MELLRQRRVYPLWSATELPGMRRGSRNTAGFTVREVMTGLSGARRSVNGPNQRRLVHRMIPFYQQTAHSVIDSVGYRSDTGTRPVVVAVRSHPCQARIRPGTDHRGMWRLPRE